MTLYQAKETLTQVSQRFPIWVFAIWPLQKQAKYMSNDSVQSMVFCQDGGYHWVGRHRNRCGERAAVIFAVLSSFWVPRKPDCVDSDLTTGTLSVLSLVFVENYFSPWEIPLPLTFRYMKRRWWRVGFSLRLYKVFIRKPTEMGFFWKTQCLKIRIIVLGTGSMYKGENWEPKRGQCIFGC